MNSVVSGQRPSQSCGSRAMHRMDGIQISNNYLSHLQDAFLRKIEGQGFLRRLDGQIRVLGNFLAVLALLTRGMLERHKSVVDDPEKRRELLDSQEREAQFTASDVDVDRGGVVQQHALAANGGTNVANLDLVDGVAGPEDLGAELATIRLVQGTEGLRSAQTRGFLRAEEPPVEGDSIVPHVPGANLDGRGPLLECLEDVLTLSAAREVVGDASVVSVCMGVVGILGNHGAQELDLHTECQSAREIVGNDASSGRVAIVLGDNLKHGGSGKRRRGMDGEVERMGEEVLWAQEVGKDRRAARPHEGRS